MKKPIPNINNIIIYNIDHFMLTTLPPYFIFLSTEKNRNFIKKLHSSDRPLSLSDECSFPQNVQHQQCLLQ